MTGKAVRVRGQEVHVNAVPSTQDCYELNIAHKIKSVFSKVT